MSDKEKEIRDILDKSVKGRKGERKVAQKVGQGNASNIDSGGGSVNVTNNYYGEFHPRADRRLNKNRNHRRRGGAQHRGLSEQDSLYIEKRSQDDRRQTRGSAPDGDERREFLRRRADLMMAKEQHDDNMLWVVSLSLGIMAHILLFTAVLTGSFFR